ncbi:uncharacterized protein LOC110988357 [Acanthaster planci]|uniref:Uncharacterized protein LOC110988357 n=1 Tax=Acanthaster planci TaxID=133434 RepID=A0A8B7ZPF5_ACAPL|nr:uncharacterized protein LOC110988357 [Acanthaster planci]
MCTGRLGNNNGLYNQLIQRAHKLHETSSLQFRQHDTKLDFWGGHQQHVIMARIKVFVISASNVRVVRAWPRRIFHLQVYPQKKWYFRRGFVVTEFLSEEEEKEEKKNMQEFDQAPKRNRSWRAINHLRPRSCHAMDTNKHHFKTAFRFQSRNSVRRHLPLGSRRTDSQTDIQLEKADPSWRSLASATLSSTLPKALMPDYLSALNIPHDRVSWLVNFRACSTCPDADAPRYLLESQNIADTCMHTTI